MTQLPTAPAAPTLQQPSPMHLNNAENAVIIMRDQFRQHVRITLYSLAGLYSMVGLVNSAQRAVESLHEDIEVEANDVIGREL